MGMISNLMMVSKEELDSYLSDSELLSDRVYNNNDADAQYIEIDKAWDGILYLLTGQGFMSIDSPLVQIFFSGELVDEEQDFGYGPAHYLTPDKVSSLNDLIKDIDSLSLKANFNPSKMNELEIYPSIWDDGDEAFEYLQKGFEDVQQLFANAANQEKAIITFLS